MKITKRQLRRIIKEEKAKLAEGPQHRAMINLGSALEDARHKAQIAVDSNEGDRKKLASKIQLELKGLLEMLRASQLREL